MKRGHKAEEHPPASREGGSEVSRAHVSGVATRGRNLRGSAVAGWLSAVAVAGWLALAPVALAQRRPHIGYTYPAGGQAGTTFAIKLGGQDLDDVNAVLVTGEGVTARVVDYYRRLNNQEIQLLNEQLRGLKRATTPPGKGAAPAPPADGDLEAMRQLIAKIEKRTGAWVQQPACASISSLVFVEVTIAPEAPVGPRELRLATPRGISNPLAFHVGQLPEYSRKPMGTAIIQILGKEAQALRRRPAAEEEVTVALPCTLNGQIASGEVNRYRFTAGKGQRLVISTLGRQLIPYIADAVPGWFQPVLVLHDAQGREVAFSDDYRFRPDPVILFEVPREGEYVLTIHDGIYRGREDFVYRITIGELPFVTSVFPLGGQAGAALTPGVGGLNVRDAQVPAPVGEGRPGLLQFAASRMGYDSNRVPFSLDPLPDEFEREPNNAVAAAQPVELPVVINGRIDRPDDRDVYRFAGKAGDTVVAEVHARRLDSPLDSVIKLTDSSGRLLAYSDDREDLMAGVNTHHADSYFLTKLPADGTYFVHVGDTARNGGEEYAYRLRLSAPQPDFELRIVPSSVAVPVNGTVAVTVYAARKDGFAGPIRLALQNPPAGFSAAPVTLAANQTTARLAIRGGAKPTNGVLQLVVVGSAKAGARELLREAVPADDRMQAFLWRHLVPAAELPAIVFDPRYQPPPRRAAPVRAPAVPIASTVAAVASAAASGTPAGAGTAAATAAKPKFTQQQIAGRLRQLKLLYEEGLLTDAFYDEKVAECESAQ
jgi:hypothetical protein